MAETTKTIMEQIGDFLGRKFNQIKAYVDEKVGDLSSYFKYDTKTGSATIGASSTSTRNNEVSVGSDKLTRFIANVTAGVKNTDAVNVAQMKKAIADLVNGAPETLDTLKEIADALTDNSDVIEVLRQLINEKYEEVNNYAKTIDARVTNVEGDVKNLTTSYNKISGDISTIKGNITNINTEITNVNGRVDDIGTYAQFVAAFNAQVGSSSIFYEKTA